MDFANGCIARVYPEAKFSSTKDAGTTGNFIVKVDGQVVHDKKAENLSHVGEKNINEFLEKVKIQAEGRK